jgi:hypothetical protein
LALSLSVPLLENQLPAFEPSAQEQELFELINRMRMDPQGELGYLFESTTPRLEANDDRIDDVLKHFGYPTRTQLLTEWQDLTPAPPLAWNESLTSAAHYHSNKMVEANEQAHTITSLHEPPLPDRVANAGYDPLIHWDEEKQEYVLALSENIYAYGKGAYGDFSAASFTHAAFAIDWGNPDAKHRENIMDALYSEVGISMIRETNPDNTVGSVGEWITTVDFASPQSSSTQDGGWLVGVAYDDANGNHSYDAGEGLGNVPLLVEADDGTSYQITTMEAGGYQLFLESGTYTVTASGEHFSRLITKPFYINHHNAKVDFLKQDAENIPPELDLNGPDVDGVGYRNIFVEGGDPVAIVAPDWTITDEDDRELHSAQVYLVDRPDGQMELLDVDTADTDLIARFDSSTGVLTIEGTQPISLYRQVLSTLTYINVSDRADLSERAIHISVFDGVDPSDEVVSTLRIEPSSLPALSISSPEMVEGDEGAMQLGFQLTLSEAPRREITLDYELQAGTAQPGVDYHSDGPGQITFAADQTEATVYVPVLTNFLGEEDKSFTFALTGFQGVHCDQPTALGTILDDDNYIELGEVAHWVGPNVDPTERRQLYAFEPEHDGHYAWDALYSGSADDVRLEVYQGSHQGAPLATSTFVNGDRQHLSFVADDLNTYVVKVTGNVPIEQLRMSLIAREDPENREIELVGRPGVLDEFVIDMRDGFQVGLGDLFTFYQPQLFDRILLNGIDPQDRLTIVGSDAHEHAVLDASNPVVEIGEEQLELGGIENIDYFGSGGLDTLLLRGTGGSDRLSFESGTATFSGPNFRYRTFGVETVQVEGIGGEDKASFLDTLDNDLLSLTSGRVSLVGDGYRLDALDFEHLIATASVEGYDRAILYGKDNALIRMSDNVSTYRSGDLYYIAEGFEEVTAMEVDDTQNRVVLLGSSGNDEFNAMAGFATATNHRDSYIHQVFGFDEIILPGETIGLDHCRMPMPLPDETWSEMEDHFLLTGPRGQIEIDMSISVQWYERETTGSQTSHTNLETMATFALLADEDDRHDEEEETSAARPQATDQVLLDFYYGTDK